MHGLVGFFWEQPGWTALSEKSTTPALKMRRKRLLPKLLAFFVAAATAAILCITGAVLLVLNNLEFITEWSIGRLLPGASVELKHVELHNWNEVRVQELQISSKKSGATLLRLEGGRMVFAYDELLSGKLREIDLVAPELTASPDLFALFSGKGESSPSERRVPPAWSVNSLQVNNARFTLPASDRLPVDIRAQFSMHWENLDLRSDAIHTTRELKIDAVSASWAGQETAIAHIQNIAIDVSLAGLFEERRIESITLGSGSITMDGDGWQKIQHLEIPQTPSDSDKPAKDPWTLGMLEITGIDVHLKDLAAPLGAAHFKISGILQELGNRSDDTPVSEIRLQEIQVQSTPEESPPLLTLDEVLLRFTFSELITRKIRDIELTNPSISIRTELSTIPKRSGPPRGTRLESSDPAALPDWQIGRLSSRYAELSYNPQKPGEPIITTRLAFDFQNIGTSEEVFDQLHNLVIWDLQLRESIDEPRPILEVDSANVSFSLKEILSEKTIRQVSTSGGRLRIGEALATLIAARTPASDTAPGSTSDNAGWRVGKLDITGIRTRLDDARPDVSDIFLTINTELDNVPLGMAATELLDEVRMLEFSDVEIRSPVNREILILKLRSVFVRFTINELLKNEIREVVILRPTIYLNQDLFIYMERATARNENAAPTPDRPNWTIDSVETKFGRLVIGSGSGSDVGLPLGFESKVQNLSFDRLAELQIDAALQIPKQSYIFKNYQIELESVEGDLRFSYPPEKGVQNLVQKLDIQGIRWRQFEAGTSWIAVTFDRQGINGQFGGEAYTGYVNGGFSFFFQNDSPWIGWVSGEGIDTAQLTDVISPQNFQMTGPLTFELQIDAFSKNIDRIIGGFSITEPGEMRITKMDDLLTRIPESWSAIKSSSTRIALETLRDYTYTEAAGRLWFVQSQGILNLDLLGPTGKRAFEIVLHDGDASQGLWQDESWGKR